MKIDEQFYDALCFQISRVRVLWKRDCYIRIDCEFILHALQYRYYFSWHQVLMRRVYKSVKGMHAIFTHSIHDKIIYVCVEQAE